jgi:hypothetical protein
MIGTTLQSRLRKKSRVFLLLINANNSTSVIAIKKNVNEGRIVAEMSKNKNAKKRLFVIRKYSEMEIIKKLKASLYGMKNIINEGRVRKSGIVDPSTKTFFSVLSRIKSADKNMRIFRIIIPTLFRCVAFQSSGKPGKNA